MFFSSNIAEGVGFFVCFKVQGVGLVWDHAFTIHGLLRLLYRSVFRQFRKSNRKKYTKNGKSIKYTGTIYLEATPALWGAKYLIVVVYKKVACCCCCCFPHYYSLLFFTIYFHVGKLFSRFVFFARVYSCLCVSFCVFFVCECVVDFCLSFV